MFKTLATLWTALICGSCSIGEQTLIPDPAIKLFVMDCGNIAVSDFGIYSDTGDYDGQSGPLAAPCFVVRHPKGDLMWETGVADRFVGTDGWRGGVFHFATDETTESRLASIGMEIDDIDFIAFSHHHSDHSGNAGLFADATWIADSAERELMFSDEARARNSFRNFENLEFARTILIEGDTHDVFGDGAVVIISTPGHTVGHLSLLVRLPKFGPVMISGDLYHFAKSRTHRRVPRFNHDRAATLASMDRFEEIARQTGAVIIVNHDAETVRKLPTAPEFLQ